MPVSTIEKTTNVAELSFMDEPEDGDAVDNEQQFLEIEIFRAGTHTDSSGSTKKWSTGDIDEIVNSYDPENFRAPLIISHDIDAYSLAWKDDTAELSDAEKHQAVLLKSLAYGYPHHLERRGTSLFALFEKIDDNFVDWVRNGNLMAISSSIYPPGHPANPSPNLYSLRHIAALGSEPPAVKGMKLELKEFRESLEKFVSFAESEAAYFSFSAAPSTKNAITFSTNDSLGVNQRIEMAVELIANQVKQSGTSNHGAYVSGEGLDYVGKILRSMRDAYIAENGVEAADRAFPSDMIGIIENSKGQYVATENDLDNVYRNVDSLYFDLLRELESMRERLNEFIGKDKDYAKDDDYKPGYREPPVDSDNNKPSNHTDPQENPMPTELDKAPVVDEPTNGSDTQPAADNGTDDAAGYAENKAALAEIRKQLTELTEKNKELSDTNKTLSEAFKQQRRHASYEATRAELSALKLPTALTEGVTVELPNAYGYSEGSPVTMASFVSTLSDKQRQWFMGHVKALEGCFGELGEDTVPDLDDGDDLQMSPAELAKRAKQYQAKVATQGTKIELAEAVDAILNGEDVA